MSALYSSHKYTHLNNGYGKFFATYNMMACSLSEFENSNFLPHDVSLTVLALLEIRNQTFRKAPQRYQEDYIKYEESETYMDDPTQFYPMHELQTYPKNYNVNKKVDSDFCEKNFPQHHHFADGIFSISCCCEVSITYGFEIMMAHESARHFFKFLMNRKINLTLLLPGYLTNDYSRGGVFRTPKLFSANLDHFLDSWNHY